jgi:hypothetical protein
MEVRVSGSTCEEEWASHYLKAATILFHNGNIIRHICQINDGALESVD